MAKEIPSALKQLFANQQLAGADELIDSLTAVGKLMGEKLARAAKVERVLPSLVESVVACDLRYSGGEAEGEFNLDAMAIVRLELDGVDDAIFHCSPLTLKRLVKTLEDAVRDLENLSKLAQKLQKTEEGC